MSKLQESLKSQFESLNRACWAADIAGQYAERDYLCETAQHVKGVYETRYNETLCDDCPADL